MLACCLLGFVWGGVSFSFLFFAFFLRKISLYAIFNLFVCLLLPTQKRRLLSIKLNIALSHPNSSVQRVTQACGQNLWLHAPALSW